MRISVGRWASPELRDDRMQTLVEAGASHVASTLLETRQYLAEAAQVEALTAASNAA